MRKWLSASRRSHSADAGCCLAPSSATATTTCSRPDGGSQRDHLLAHVLVGGPDGQHLDTDSGRDSGIDLGRDPEIFGKFIRRERPQFARLSKVPLRLERAPGIAMNARQADECVELVVALRAVYRCREEDAGNQHAGTEGKWAPDHLDGCPVNISTFS